MDSKEQGSTLGKTFTFRRVAMSISTPRRPGYSLGKTSSSFFKPLAPPPRIPSLSRLSSYIQELLPTSYPAVGTPMEYNFNPMTGWPLKLLILSTYSLPSQPLGASFSTPTNPGMMGLLALPGLSREECPLVVGSPSHSSWVVADGRIPTVTVSSTTVETTLLASPKMAPRISTSCGNVTQGDICTVIQQHPHPSPNRALAGVGVGRGLTRKPMRLSGSRGQMLVEMLTNKGMDRGQALAGKLGGTSVGRGQSAPSPPVRRPEQKERQVGTHTEASLPPPVTMHLDHQGPPVTYSEAASRLPLEDGCLLWITNVWHVA